MIQFTPEFSENFLSIVRKYMQLRGGITQKELSEMTNVGISTMSRFLNLKTAQVDAQLVANIVAALGIPLHEIIDGIAEESTDTFKGLVQFYKEHRTTNTQAPPQENDEAMAESLGGSERTRTKTTASINVGGRKQSMPFGEQDNNPPRQMHAQMNLRDKLQTLSPRQKAYITEFLDLDLADRDLVVDLGDAVFRYIRQRAVNF